MTAQFYKVEYKTGGRSYTVYERGRAKLFSTLGECVTGKVEKFTVTPVDREDVPTFYLTDLEAK